MKLTQRQIGEVAVLDLDGRLVLDEGDVLLRDRVNELLAQGQSRILLNLRDVTYIDSCGLGALIAKLVSARNRGGDLKLLNVSPRSHRVLEICKLEHIFELFDSEEEAVASFSTRQGI